ARCGRVRVHGHPGYASRTRDGHETDPDRTWEGPHVSDTSNITPDAGDSGAGAAEAASSAPRRKSGGGLNGKVLAELQQIAGGLGIKGTARMRKSALIEAIQAAQQSQSSDTDT